MIADTSDSLLRGFSRLMLYCILVCNEENITDILAAYMRTKAGRLFFSYFRIVGLILCNVSNDYIIEDRNFMIFHSTYEKGLNLKLNVQKQSKSLKENPKCDRQ